MTIIGSKGDKGNQMKDRFAAAITTRNHISYILRVSKWFRRQLGKENGKLDAGWHMLHIDRHRIKVIRVWVLKNSHQCRSIRKECLNAHRKQRKLDNQGRIG